MERSERAQHVFLPVPTGVVLEVPADHLPIFTASFGGGEEHLSGARCDVEDPVARPDVHVLDEPSCEVGEMAGSNRVVGSSGPRKDADHCLLR